MIKKKHQAQTPRLIDNQNIRKNQADKFSL